MYKQENVNVLQQIFYESSGAFTSFSKSHSNSQLQGKDPFVDRCFGYSADLDIQNGRVIQPAVLVMKTLNHKKSH
jgi:hypothetical protein